MSHKLVSLYIGDGEYYTRIDADAVIAELEKKLKEQTSIYAEAVKELYEKNKELRHHKYKRCLRNAEGCLYKVWYYDEVHDRNASNRMWKWRQHWLKLAEQFKEGV